MQVDNEIKMVMSRVLKEQILKTMKIHCTIKEKSKMMIYNVLTKYLSLTESFMS